MSNLNVNGLNIAMLSDEDLYRRLKQLGVTCGPIVDTTRAVYQRKLARVLRNEVVEESYDDDEEEEDEYVEEESTINLSHAVRWDDLRRRPLNRSSPRWESTPVTYPSRRIDVINRVMDQERPRQAGGKSSLSLTAKFIIVVVGILIILLIYQNMECSVNNPIPSNYQV